ncbi:MAG: LysR family transcriptional regulator [Bdellovibrionales bacterium]
MTMITHDLNLNLLRVFESVFRTKSMTEAARELHLTQSGVSQHMNSLEEILGVKLFDRVKQRLVATEAGQLLYKQSNTTLNELESVIWQLKGQERAFVGVVNIGMPIEFGNNVVMPLIAEFSKKHPLVNFKFNLGYATTMNELLLKGELDFAIIDEFRMDRNVMTTKVFDEIVELCASEELLKAKGVPKHSISYYESLDYVEYQEGEPLLRMWFGHHLNKPRADVRVKAYIMDVQGIARLIINGVGAGILPSYLIDRLQQSGQKVYVFKGSGKPLKNSIGIAKLSQRTLSRSAEAAYDYLLQRLTSAPSVESKKTPAKALSLSN